MIISIDTEKNIRQNSVLFHHKISNNQNEQETHTSLETPEGNILLTP